MVTKSKKRKKLDILYRQLNNAKTDPNSTWNVLQEIKTEEKIRRLNGERKKYPHLKF